MAERRGAWYGSRWIRAERRCAIYARDAFRCVWCGGTSMVGLDHLWRPVERPGKPPKYDNRSHCLVTCCGWCNSSRSGLTLRWWLRRLRLQGKDVRVVVARLRHATRTPVDMVEGRRLAADPTMQQRRRAAGRLHPYQYAKKRGVGLTDVEREAFTGEVPF